MSHVLRALPDLMRVGVAGAVAYRAELVIWILTATLPLVMLAMWNAVALDGPVAGFDQDGLARYFVATLVIRQATSVWLVWEMNYEIRSGRLSTKLLRPLHPFWQYATSMLTVLPMRLVVLVPLVAALVWWRPTLLAWPGLAAVLLALASTALAWILTFLVQACFASLAFFLDKTDGLFGVWFGMWALLSGYVAPLAIFPDWARPMVELLPFRGMLAVPVELLGGFLSPAEAMTDIALQLLWVGVFAVLTGAVWRRGIARYGAYGA